MLKLMSSVKRVNPFIHIITETCSIKYIAMYFNPQLKSSENRGSNQVNLKRTKRMALNLLDHHGTLIHCEWTDTRQEHHWIYHSSYQNVDGFITLANIPRQVPERLSQWWKWIVTHTEGYGKGILRNNKLSRLPYLRKRKPKFGAF